MDSIRAVGVRAEGLKILFRGTDSTYKRDMNDAKGSAEDERDLTLLSTGERRYPQSPDEAVLETFSNPTPGRDYTIRFECPEFTSLCPITGQPDFAAIDIEYVPDKRCVESKSLKLYLYAYRNHGGFGEAIVNRVLDDLIAACAPRRARVTGRFAPRGGIGITVTAEHGAP